jgi:hypothetical protein
VNQSVARLTNDYGIYRNTPGTPENCMKMKVQLVIENESGGITTTEVIALERGVDGLIGLSLAEAKAMNACAQRALIDAQAGDVIARGAVCPDCQEGLRRNGTHTTLYRTAFGRIKLTSPRFYTCRCQGIQRTSRSPLSAWLGSHISPELEYLEGQFAALLPYGVSARILNTVLPLENATSVTSWHRRIGRIGERLDREAHDELAVEPQFNEFGLPKRHPLQAVGIDGAYVKATDAPSRQEGWFEVIVGKSLPRQKTGNVFAFVHRLEQKPTERMAHFLAEQGVDPTQPTTLLSDGGETVRIAQGHFRTFGEPILDWFHIAMRMTALTQTLKGVKFDETEVLGRKDNALRELRRAKAFLWHGSVHTALEVLDDFSWLVEAETEASKSFLQRLEEFTEYIATNMAAIPNYADRCRHGEPIATGSTESAVNQVVSKRMVKKQQMRWTQRGAHTLLQIRTRVLNGQLRQDFERWHPQLAQTAAPQSLAA